MLTVFITILFHISFSKFRVIGSINNNNNNNITIFIQVSLFSNVDLLLSTKDLFA